MTLSIAEKRDTIVLGASAGGIEALRRLLPAFTADIEASVFVVQHTPADGRSLLDTVLNQATAYHAAFAQDGEVISTRRVYVAPPNRHLLIEEGRIRLWHGAREPRPASHRPLFRSAGVARGGRVVAGILSGLLDDGASGLLSVKRCGGLAFVQSPSDAVESEMPERAAEVLGDSLDGALSAEQLGLRMVELMGTAAPSSPPVPDDVKLEMDMLLGGVSALEVLSQQGPPLPLSCPECGGPLWSLRDGRLQRYRCHTGHTYGVDSLLSGQGNQIEQALWAAIKGLEQRGQMLTNLSKDEGVSRRPSSAALFGEAVQLRRHAQTLREVLVASFRDTRAQK